MAASYIIFFLFGALAAASGVLMVTRKNVMESAAFFLTSILATGGIFLQLRAEFVFGAQIILCAGGVGVLFFFILLLLKPDIPRQKQFSEHTRIATALAVILGGLALAAAGIGDRLFGFPAPSNSVLPANTGEVAQTFFQNYPLALEMVPILLLIAMIGAVVMAKRSV